MYFFKIGELFDAYLNRDISHKSRIIMVMRCYFFLQMWKEYLSQCHDIYQNKWYLISKTCISMQSFKIFTSLAESMLLIILAYRKYYSNFPFFPWEHGTEAIEHVFGVARQIVSDFTYYEFYKIINKVMYRDKILRLENLINYQDKTSAQDILLYIIYTYIRYKIN